MTNHVLVFLVLNTAVSAQAPQADDRSAVTAAARELARQLDALQLAFATIPGPSEGRGLFRQADLLQFDVVYFRQLLANQQSSAEDLAIAFDKIDGKVNRLLGDLQGFAKWEPAIRMTVRRVRAAENDLHFALFSPQGPSDAKGQVAYRQTLTLLDRTENLENLVRYVFAERAELPRWTDLFQEMRQGIAELQKLEKTKAARADLQNQLIKTDEPWEKLVGKLKQLPDSEYLLLGAGFAQVDRTLDRLAGLYGLNNRRPVLRSPLD